MVDLTHQLETGGKEKENDDSLPMLFAVRSNGSSLTKNTLRSIVRAAGGKVVTGTV
jgi:hypothetical protein